MRFLCVLGAVTLVFSASAHAKLNPNEKDASKILDAAFERDDGDRMVERLKMTLSDSRGRKRERLLQRRSMKFKGGEKALVIFESPGDLRNTGLLSVRYDKGNKAPDQWLYLPGLGRSTRISSRRRSGSFVGSDLSYADMVTPDPDDYNAVLINGDAKVGGDPCWHIEITPKTKEEKEETGYNKMELWISKKSLLTIRMKGFMRNGRTKYISLSKVREVGGVWTAGRIKARTLRDDKLQSETTIDQLEVAFNQASVRESDFTTHRLEKGL